MVKIMLYTHAGKNGYPDESATVDYAIALFNKTVVGWIIRASITIFSISVFFVRVCVQYKYMGFSRIKKLRFSNLFVLHRLKNC